jgi:hypothetical protein
MANLVILLGKGNVRYGRHAVMTAVKRWRMRGVLWYSSSREMKRDTGGENDTPRFTADNIDIDAGKNLINEICKITREDGYDTPFHAGIDIYLD